MQTETTGTAAKEVSEEELDRVFRHHVYVAVGVGLIPVPIADFLGLTATQISLLRKIAMMYDTPFFKDAVKNILSSLLGGAFPTAVAVPLAASMAKALPITGQATGVITMPVVAGATTYAVGRVFARHFASGGTFLTFDAEKVKGYYAEMFREGKKVAADMRKKKRQ